jgi:hypothetical protein
MKTVLVNALNWLGLNPNILENADGVGL